MARIAGVNLPRNKRVEIGLGYLYGIGLPLSKKILDATNIDGNTRTEDLTEDQVVRLKDYIEKNYRVEGDLRREVMMNIKRLKDIGSYRGMRHSKKLPVRGQRTRTNTRTVRGNVRKTMGSGRKAAAQKT
jgi:small subunit ribosomal protein S13